MLQIENKKGEYEYFPSNNIFIKLRFKNGIPKRFTLPYLAEILDSQFPITVTNYYIEHVDKSHDPKFPVLFFSGITLMKQRSPMYELPVFKNGQNVLDEQGNEKQRMKYTSKTHGIIIQYKFMGLYSHLLETVRILKQNFDAWDYLEIEEFEIFVATSIDSQ